MSTIDIDRLHAFARMDELVRGGRWLPTWRSDGRGFCVLDGAPEQATILDFDAETGTSRPLLDVDAVRKSLAGAIGAPLPWSGLPFMSFRLLDGDSRVEFEYADRWFSVAVASSEVTELPVPEQERRKRALPREIGKTFLGPRQPIHEVPAPDGKRLLTLRDGDLSLRYVADDRLSRLTSDASADVSWSVEHACWSLDGRYVAAIRTDATGVARFPIMHWLKPLEEVEWVPYSKSGWRQASRALCVIDTVSGAVRSVELERSGEDIFALQPLVFDREGRLLFLVSDRRNKVLELRRADAQSGTSAVLIEERQETFVYGINLAAMLTVATPLPDGKHLVWMSERDGWRHAYLYTLDGTLVRALTSGDFEVDRVAGTDNVNGRIYLVARSDVARPYDQHLCVVGLDGTSFRQLTTDPGVHSPMVSPSGATIVDIHSGIARPPRTDLLTPDGDVVKTLARAETDRLDELGYEPPEQFVTLALDGVTPIHGAMYLPPRFDAAKRYPVVEYIYAGPQVSLFPNDYSGPSLARLLAQVGFIGVVLDAPGTPGRGKRFQDAVAGRFGQFEIEEHANALRQLGDRHPFLDLTRVGIVGGSWGGYNSVRALLRAPDTYHAGVAIYPVADCMDHIGTAIEPYLGLPQDDPAAYAAASSLPLVDRLRGKLYLIHGTSDVNAPFSATMQLVDAFIKANKPVDLLAIPEMDHSMAGSAGTYVIDRMAEYFAEHLGSARSASPSA